jgi:hypothetical protein
MLSTEKPDTHGKPLSLDLDTSKLGSFAEIGAGQAVARRTILAYLVHAGLADPVCFPASEAPVPPNDFLHKKAVAPAAGSWADLREAVRGFSAIEFEWTETNGYVSAEQPRFKPPLDHLYAYLLASDFLIPMRTTARATGGTSA